MLHVGLAGLLCAIYGATVNTLVEDGDRANTFCVFNPTQAEQNYSIFLGSPSIMFSPHLWIGVADESAALELADATLGLAFNLETFYIGLGLVSSWRTNLNTPIPVSRGYAGRCMNALGAPVGGMHTEMSDFRCLGPFEAGITAIDAMS